MAFRIAATMRSRFISAPPVSAEIVRASAGAASMGRIRAKSGRGRAEIGGSPHEFGLFSATSGASSTRLGPKFAKTDHIHRAAWTEPGPMLMNFDIYRRGIFSEVAAM